MLNKIKKYYLRSINLKAGIWYTFSNIINQAIAFFVMPIFTRLLLPEDYGMVNTYIAWVGIISIFIGLCLHACIMTAYKDFKNDFNQFMSSIFFLSFIVFITISIIIFLIINIFNLDFPMILTVFALVQSYSGFIIMTYSQELVMKVKYKLYAFINSSVSIINVILSIVLILFVLKDRLYMGRIFSVFFINSVFAIAIFFFVTIRGKKLVNLTYWKYALTYSVPIIAHAGCLYIMGQSDRLMITHFAGLAATGVYSVIYNFGMIPQVISSSISNVWHPLFTEKMQEKEYDFINKKSVDFLRTFTLLTITIMLVSPEVIKLMVSEKYISGIPMLIPIVLSAYVMFIYSFYATNERYYKKTKLMSLCTIVAASLNIVLNLIFIPMYGATAAAYTTLIAYIVSAMIHYFASRFLNKSIFNIRLFMADILFVLLFAAISVIFINCWIVRWFLLFIVYILCLKKFFIKTNKIIKN